VRFKDSSKHTEVHIELGGRLGGRVGRVGAEGQTRLGADLETCCTSTTVERVGDPVREVAGRGLQVMLQVDERRGVIGGDERIAGPTGTGIGLPISTAGNSVVSGMGWESGMTGGYESAGPFFVGESVILPCL
jgi:hypothetical protein